MRGDEAAERKADEMDLVDAERIEQLDIVHDVVVEGVHRGVVARTRQSPGDRDG